MMKLEGSNVQLHALADSKTDAIRKVCKLLVDSGHIKPGYIDSMLGREKVANTFRCRPSTCDVGEFSGVQIRSRLGSAC